MLSATSHNVLAKRMQLLSPHMRRCNSTSIISISSRAQHVITAKHTIHHELLPLGNHLRKPLTYSKHSPNDNRNVSKMRVLVVWSYSNMSVHDFWALESRRQIALVMRHVLPWNYCVAVVLLDHHAVEMLSLLHFSKHLSVHQNVVFQFAEFSGWTNVWLHISTLHLKTDHLWAVAAQMEVFAN